MLSATILSLFFDDVVKIGFVGLCIEISKTIWYFSFDYIFRRVSCRKEK